jgi:hypothetical protein
MPYLRWNLDLTPGEYWEMDVEDWHMATAVQSAWRDGQQAVMDDERKRKERDARHEANRARLRG